MQTGTQDRVPAVQVRAAVGELDRAAGYVVRGAVFVAEQGVPAALEPDAEDPGADHVLARIGGAPAGTGRLVADGDTGILGRLAVLPAARGAGLGALLVAELEAIAAERGLARVELHSQLHARGFYDRLGYTARGGVYTEAGIEHITMAKELAPRG
ncbi:GNAT family N-acetyltransferase [Nocardiopsis coralliicola]